MKRVITLYLFLISTSFMLSAQQWSWATEVGSGGLTIDACAHDDVSYVTGYFSGIQSFGGTVLNRNDGDIFVCKVAHDDGGILSAHQLPHFSNGQFSFTCDEQDFHIFSIHPLSSPTKLGILEKRDAAGTLAWTFDFTGPPTNPLSSTLRLHALTTDANGNIYVVGTHEREIFYNGTSITNDPLGMFILKVNGFGTIQWIHTTFPNNTIWTIHDIAVDHNGNTAIIGDFRQRVTFGTTELSSRGDHDTFILTLNDNGQMRWVQQIGGVMQEEGAGIVFDDTGNIYVTGMFHDLAQFSSTVSTSSAGSYDIYIAKYDPAGTVLWATSAGGISRDWVQDIDVNSEGECVITGAYRGTAAFGNIMLTFSPLFPLIHDNIFIAGTSSDGVFAFAEKTVSHGGTASEVVNIGNVVHTSNDAIYVTGTFTHIKEFGSHIIGTAGSTPKPFIAKYRGNISSTEKIIKKDLTIYPNPSNGLFTLETTIPGLLSKSIVTITDIHGTEVHRSSGVPSTISLDHVPPGVYILMLFNEDVYVSQRIMKGE